MVRYVFYSVYTLAVLTYLGDLPGPKSGLHGVIG